MHMHWIRVATGLVYVGEGHQLHDNADVGDMCSTEMI